MPTLPSNHHSRQHQWRDETYPFRIQSSGGRTNVIRSPRTHGTQTSTTGTSSVVIDVKVEAERFDTGDHALVTEATLTMVSVCEKGKPIPFTGPPTVEAKDVT